MTALVWIAAILSLALVFPPSLRLVNEGLYVRVREYDVLDLPPSLSIDNKRSYVGVRERDVLDRSIPIGSLRAIAFAAAATWFLTPGAQAAGDVRTFPLAVVMTSGVMGVVTLLGFLRSLLSPFGGPSRY